MAADQQKPREKSVKSRSPAAKPAGTRPAGKAPSAAQPAGATTRAAPMRPKPAARKAPAGKPVGSYTADEIRTIFERFRAVAPEPKGELDHVNPFTLLVAVVLSAQATDVGVNKATRELFRLADTPAKMVALGEDRVRDLIKTIGLFRNKAKNTILLSQALLDRFGGEVPADRDALVSLPGVGRKTANVVLNGAFGQPTLAVDTHILRLGNRLRLAPGKTPDEVEAALLKVIPDEFLRHAHHWLILHGRYVCKARKPDCAQCVIADLCRSDEKTNAVPLPLEIARAGYPRGAEPAPEA
ncbi:endonuclease III [Prosthecodimorpha staleyi]|uniref:Endonuclease III n=1 Tax=Prosthecodimorpha staleyi TaxID=2840188 RepID=A0A947D7S7_9HYPH|nr:endonuclease III [Prosthecodimorpha staleyi]